MTPARAYKLLLARALAYPGAWEDHPWDHVVVKVAKKIFLFVGNEAGLSLSLKLPHSGEAALTMFGWAEPTAYGLGKSGWISAAFAPGEDVPAELLLEWLDESYRAVAPKKLLKASPAVSGAGRGAARPAPRRARAAPRPAARPPRR